MTKMLPAFFALKARPALLSLGVVAGLFGSLGSPWIHPASSTTMLVGWLGGGQANSIVAIQAGSATGTATTYANVDLNGVNVPVTGGAFIASGVDQKIIVPGRNDGANTGGIWFGGASGKCRINSGDGISLVIGQQGGNTSCSGGTFLQDGNPNTVKLETDGGNLNLPNGVQIGGGTLMTLATAFSSSGDFAAPANNSCLTSTIGSVTGVISGSTCTVNNPTGSSTYTVNAYGTAAGTVTIQLCCQNAEAACADPPALTYKGYCFNP